MVHGLVTIVALATVCFGNFNCSNVTDPVSYTTVAECDDCTGKTVLNVDTKECIDRKIFTDFIGYEIPALIIWFVGAGLAISAGVGGGGIFVPLGVLLVRFDLTPATALSQCSIFGASLAGLLLNTRNRHPIADRPLIDVDMVLFLAPMEIAGAIFGYIILSMVPKWLSMLLTVIVLGFTGYRTFMKGRQMWKKDKKAKLDRELAKKSDTAVDPLQGADALTSTPSEQPTLRHRHSEKHEAPPELTAGDSANETESATKPDDVAPRIESKFSKKPRNVKHSVEKWLEKDASRPIKKAMYLAILWIGLLLLIIFKGGKGKDPIIPEITFCSVGYWILTLVQFLWMFGFALLMGKRAVSKTLRKQAVNFPFVAGDVLWTWPNFTKYSSATFVAGIIAGMIGIGGGMVLGPLMLQLGVLPQVSSASTATMIAMTSSSVAVMAIIQGNIPWSYALTFFVTAFCGALIGKYKIDKIVKKRDLTSLLIFLLAGIISFASLAMLIFGLITYGKKDWQFYTDADDKFRSPCHGYL